MLSFLKITLELIPAAPRELAVLAEMIREQGGNGKDGKYCWSGGDLGSVATEIERVVRTA